MFGRKIAGFVASFAFLAGLAFGASLLANPAPANALYAAGIKDGDICTCPVMVGDCVCHIIK